MYIQEIEGHKRSIFEFWKFTNKDLPDALTEAQKLKQEENKKIKRFLLSRRHARFRKKDG